jgi:hypothetical protein
MSMTQTTNRRLNIQLAGLVLSFFLQFVQAGTICFQPERYTIEGFLNYPLVKEWIPLTSGNTDEGTRDAAMLIGNFRESHYFVSLLLVRHSLSKAAVIDTLFTVQDDPQQEDWKINSADLDRDGNAEIFLAAHSPENLHCFKKIDGRYREVDLPFPRCSWPKMAWMDFNKDGYPDLVLVSQQPEGNFTRETVRLFRNNKGVLEPVPDSFHRENPIDSLQTLDLNGDGSDELIVYPLMICHRCPWGTRIYQGCDQGLREIELPYLGRDNLIGLCRAFSAVGDIDGDHVKDIVMMGCWNYGLGIRTSLSLVYHRLPDLKGSLCVNDMDGFDDFPNMVGRCFLEDLDGDGDTDILAWGMMADASFTVVCLENEKGRIKRLKPEDWIQSDRRINLAHYSNIVVPGDFNNDGIMDILLFPNTSPNPILLLVNCSKRQKDNP